MSYRALALLAVLAVVSSVSLAAPAGTVRLGAVVPLTGRFASGGA